MSNINKDILDLQGLTTYDGKIKTEIAKKANDFVPIEYADWLELTEAEKSLHNWKLLHVPDDGPEPVPDVPDGKTVTPTDDVEIWLKCAGIEDSGYTTLSEVMADTGVLSALIADSNAVDYLVRSKSFAKSEALVPTMTSNTTPSGECFGSSYDASDTYFKAFDGNDASGSRWIASTARGTACYIGYHFPTATKCVKAKFIQNTLMTSTTAILQGSNDRATWTDLCDSASYTASENTIQFTKNISNYTDYRLYISTQSGSLSKGGQIITLQFYSEEGLCDNATAMSYIGLNNYASNTLLADSTWRSAICNSTYFESVLNVKVPVMTSNIAPSGECFVKDSYNNAPAFYAFNGNPASVIVASAYSSVVYWYLGYYFAENVRLYKTYLNARQTEGRTENISLTIQGTKNRSNWVDLTETMSKTLGSIDESFVNTKNIDDYVGCRIYTHGRGVRVSTLQFYGRKDV